jgi:hypothetical protein
MLYASSIPLIVIVTAVAVAKPEIMFPAAKTRERLRITVSLGSSEIALKIMFPAAAEPKGATCRVAVRATVSVLQSIICLTIVVVEAGVV